MTTPHFLLMPLEQLKSTREHQANTIYWNGGIGYRTNGAVFIWHEEPAVLSRKTGFPFTERVDTDRECRDDSIVLETSGIHKMEELATGVFNAGKLNNDFFRLLKDKNHRTFVHLAAGNSIDVNDSVAHIATEGAFKPPEAKIYVNTSYLKDALLLIDDFENVHLTIFKGEQYKALLIQPDNATECGIIIASCVE